MSTAVSLFSDGDLEILLKQCRGNNALNNLTGMLLYSEGSFVQVLEGQPDVLVRIYHKIQTDPRHKHIMKIASGKSEERMFANWTMGFKTLSKAQFSEFDAYQHPSEHDVLKIEASHPAITILKTFAESNRL